MTLNRWTNKKNCKVKCLRTSIWILGWTGIPIIRKSGMIKWKNLNMSNKWNKSTKYSKASSSKESLAQSSPKSPVSPTKNSWYSIESIKQWPVHSERHVPHKFISLSQSLHKKDSPTTQYKLQSMGYQQEERTFWSL